MKKNTRSYQITDKMDFSRKINSRISTGKEILSCQIASYEALDIIKNEISKWSDYNIELLKQSFDNPDNEYLSKYKQSYLALDFWGSHSLSIDIETQKRKISSYIKGLDKIANKIDLIPTKGIA